MEFEQVIDGLNSVFTPETLLPSQWFDQQRTALRLEGTHALLFGMVEDAVRCLGYGDATSGRKWRLYHDAWDWFMDDNGPPPFSFVAVCEAFGWEPSYVRRGLVRWLENKEPKPRMVRSPVAASRAPIRPIPPRAPDGYCAIPRWLVEQLKDYTARPAIARLSNVSSRTLLAWAKGETRQAQRRALDAVIKAVGGEPQ